MNNLTTLKWIEKKITTLSNFENNVLTGSY